MNGERLRKDVTDEELAQAMRPHVERLMQFTLRRADVRTDAPAESAKAQQSQQNAGRRALTHEERECLESVLERPFLSVTQRRDALGLSTYVNDKVKKSLLAQALVEELRLNLGAETQGLVKLLQLTEAGYGALSQPVPEVRPKNCSAEHWFWQRHIASYYRSLGFKPEIEMFRNGKRTDVGFEKDGQLVAVEVAMTAKNEAVNAKQDLAAGFSKVLIACRNGTVKRAVDEKLAVALSDQERGKVKVIQLAEFAFVKQMLGRRA